MLLANLAKYDNLKRILTVSRPSPKDLSSSPLVMDQLLDLFVKGADGTYNKQADFDYLAYLFADLAKHADGRQYFATKQEYDGVIPLTKLTVFTEHKSDIRRYGGRYESRRGSGGLWGWRLDAGDWGGVWGEGMCF